MTPTPVPRVAIIVVAAGSGSRLGVGVPKALVGIDEHTVLRHCLDRVFRAQPAQVVVVAPPGREGDATTDLLEAAGPRRDLGVVVTGGATRHESVRAGLGAVWPDVEIVLVHDAARALAPPDLFDRVVEAVRAAGPAVIPVLPVVDSMKRLGEGRILGAVDRADLAAAQTPQGFRRDVLEAAYAAADADHTDDAAVVAAAGHRVLAVTGDPDAFKITTRGDLERARLLVGAAVPRVTAGLDAPPAAPRVGLGTDVHAFGGDGSLWLAGLEWPDEPALDGHSDGDVVAHAIVDALLSAAGLGDIGGVFGTDRPEFTSAHAATFLRRTAAMVGEAGWRIGNVAAQVQAARPRLAPRRVEAERALSDALGGAAVSLSGTTTDGLGFTGRGEGVAAFAVAVLIPA